MRVLFVSHRFPPDGVAGVERMTEGLAAELARDGADVSVVTRRYSAAPPRPRLVRERLGNGTRVYRLTGGQLDIERFLAHRERLNLLFATVLLETAPDVVHVNHLLGLSPDFIDIAARHDAAVVLSLHDFFFACPLVHLRKYSGELCAGPDGGRECARTCFASEGPRALSRWGLRTLFFRRMLDGPQRIICPSRYAAAFFEKFGADAERLRVVPNGVSRAIMSAAAEQPDPAEADGLTIAFCGAVVPHKGVHLILEALRLLGPGPVSVRVLGTVADRDYARTLRAMAERIPGVRMHVYGSYEPRELPRLLSGVDCVVVPSAVPETGGLAAREALACGVPAVVAGLGALPEVVTHGENGLVFAGGCPSSLAAALRHLSDRGVRLRLRTGARSSQITSIAEHAACVREIYEEAIAAPRATRWREDGGENAFFRHALEEADFAGSAR